MVHFSNLKKTTKDETLEEYDFNSGIRGKYAKRYKKSINIIKSNND